MKKIRTYRLEDSYFKTFKDQCKNRGVKMGEVIRQLIKEWLAR
jgi:predicted DNA-binding ribbon-helix-helix protein